MHPREDQVTSAVDGEPEAPPRLPPLGKMGVYGGLPPRHTLPFEIEQNVHRIATQINTGRPATYD